MEILSKLFKRKNKQIKDDEYENIPDVKFYTDEECKLLQAKADVEALEICRKIYSFFKEHINELKEGDKFILLQENPICDDKCLSTSQICKSLSNYIKIREHIPELGIRFGEEIKTFDGIHLGFKEYYVYTINISHDNIIELYDVKFKFGHSRRQINNGNEICVTIYGVDKNIYKII